MQIHFRTVDRHLSIDNRDLHELFAETGQTDKERYEQLSAFFSEVQKKMKSSGFTLLHEWAKYIEKHPDGYKYSQFAWRFRQSRKRNDHSGKLGHRAGENLFVDFCGK